MQSMGSRKRLVLQARMICSNHCCTELGNVPLIKRATQSKCLPVRLDWTVLVIRTTLDSQGTENHLSYLEVT